jgi:hypothetical protein
LSLESYFDARADAVERAEGSTLEPQRPGSWVSPGSKSQD